jgi:hypothetical protein
MDNNNQTEILGQPKTIEDFIEIRTRIWCLLGNAYLDHRLFQSYWERLKKVDIEIEGLKQLQYERKPVVIEGIEGIKLQYSKLSCPYFVKEGALDCAGGISPRDWTIKQLRDMADYIEANPECTKFKED